MMKKTLTYLIATAAFMVISVATMAQDGESPFLNSTHSYRVTMEDGANISNTLSGWVITDNSGTALSTQPLFTATVVVDTAFLEITWADSWATSGTEYKIQFTEDDGSCSTVKDVTVMPVANSFDVLTSSPDAICNDADGQVNFSGSTATTSVSFEVDMEISSMNPDWEIEFTLTPGTGASIANVTSSSGTLSESGSYTLTDLTSASHAGTVSITMDVTGDIYSLLKVDFEITSATEMTYNASDVDNDDWTATATINPIPKTSAIATD